MVVAHKILVSAPVPLNLILTGFDWVGAGPFGVRVFGRGLTIYNKFLLITSSLMLVAFGCLATWPLATWFLFSLCSLTIYCFSSLVKSRIVSSVQRFSTSATKKAAKRKVTRNALFILTVQSKLSFTQSGSDFIVRQKLMCKCSPTSLKEVSDRTSIGWKHFRKLRPGANQT